MSESSRSELDAVAPLSASPVAPLDMNRVRFASGVVDSERLTGQTTDRSTGSSPSPRFSARTPPERAVGVYIVLDKAQIMLCKGAAKQALALLRAHPLDTM